MDVTASAVASRVEHPSTSGSGTLLERLNSTWHERALQIFLVIVLAHWAEHLTQAFQIYVLGWPVPASRGVLGHWFPWLVHSEVLHYTFAVIMLAGLGVLLPGFAGRSRSWWLAALVIQFWHHIEHALLQVQAIAGHNLFNSPVPVSIAQLWIPRVELHLFYNTVVFIPMVVAMYRHMFPPPAEAAQMQCSCAFHPRVATA
jgi:hypothetical protein